jgi:hypothetical protein
MIRIALARVMTSRQRCEYISVHYTVCCSAPQGET